MTSDKASQPPNAPPIVPPHESPIFLIVCQDGPQAKTARVEHLAGHLAHVEAHWTRYVLAGPLRHPGRPELIGSFFLVRAPDEADARALMAGDPYISCGMYERMDVFAATASIGLFMGGKIWTDVESIRHRATGG